MMFFCFVFFLSNNISVEIANKYLSGVQFDCGIFCRWICIDITLAEWLSGIIRSKNIFGSLMSCLFSTVHPAYRKSYSVSIPNDSAMRWLLLLVNTPAITSISNHAYSGSCLSTTFFNNSEPIPNPWKTRINRNNAIVNIMN